MSTQYGIIYGAEGSSDYTMDAPYSTPEDALGAYDPDRCEEMGGAALMEVHECTVEHVDADWEPGAELTALSSVDRADIEKAVEADMAWLLGGAQKLEAWEGTTPTDVGVLDLGDQTATMLTLEQVRSDKRSDELGEHAQDHWQTLASRWGRDLLDADDLQGGEGQ